MLSRIELFTYIAGMIVFASCLFDWVRHSSSSDEADSIRRLAIILCMQSLLWMPIAFR